MRLFDTQGFSSYELAEFVPITPAALDPDLFISGDCVTDGTRTGILEFVDDSPFYGDTRLLAYVVSLPGTSGMDSWGDYWALDAMWHVDGVA